MIELRYIESYVISVSDGGVLGLHEIPGAITARLPGNDAAEILEACRRACEKLVVGGFARLRQVGPHSERPTRDDYLAVDEDSVLQILCDERSYQAPRDDRPRYFLTATERGTREYVSDDAVSL